MRVKLQLVLCSEDGREETVTDIVSWNKDSHRLAHLGLTLAEAKQLLKRIQTKLLEQQIDRFLDTHSQCPGLRGPAQGQELYQPLVPHAVWDLQAAQSPSVPLHLPAAQDHLVPTLVGAPHRIGLLRNSCSSKRSGLRWPRMA